jgi:hypothetical protein
VGPVWKEKIFLLCRLKINNGGTEYVFFLGSVDSTVANIYWAADLLPKSSSSLCTITVAELGQSNLMPMTFALCSYSSFSVCRVALLPPGHLTWPIHRARGQLASPISLTGCLPAPFFSIQVQAITLQHEPSSCFWTLGPNMKLALKVSSFIYSSICYGLWFATQILSCLQDPCPDHDINTHMLFMFHVLNYDIIPQLLLMFQDHRTQIQLIFQDTCPD